MMSALSHVALCKEKFNLYIYISCEDAVIKTPCDNSASLDLAAGYFLSRLFR